MKSIIKYFTVFVLFTMFGCKTDDSFLGKEMRQASDEFEIVQPFSLSTSEVDFSAAEFVTGIAVFNEQVSYDIEIKGLTSGAVRYFSGNASTINASNFKWDGDHEELAYFRSGEIAQVTLTILGHFETYSENVLITSVTSFSDLDGVFSHSSLGFEGNTIGWPFISPNNLDSSRIISESEFDGNAIEGEQAYMFGTNVTDPGYQGEVSIAFGDQSYLGLPNSEDLYLNVYIFGEGQENSVVNISIHEDDCDIVCDVCPTYICFNEDVLTHDISLDYEGWKLHSIKYTAFQFSTYNGREGNKIQNPNEAMGFALALVAEDVGYYRVVFDAPFFSVGIPQ